MEAELPASWKRTVLTVLKQAVRWAGKTAVFAVVCTITLVLINFGYSSYQERATPVRVWNEQMIPSGMIVNLKTVSKGATVHYQLSALPSKDSDAAFRAVAEQISLDSLFTVVLEDKDGFEICRTPVNVIRIVDELGIASFSAAGSFYCGHDYTSAEKWTVLFDSSLNRISTQRKIDELNKFPSSSKSTDSVGRGEKQKRTAKDEPIIVPPEPSAEILAGFDFLSQELETRSGKKVRVSTTGLATAESWRNSARLKFRCDQGSGCVIENLENGQGVRGTLIR